MAQGCIQRNVSGQIREDWISDYPGTNYSYQSEVNRLRFVDHFQQGDTIKRLSIKRRPRVANNNADKAQSGISYGQWHSTESLSTSSDDTRLLGMLSSTTKERPPLPPQHCSSLDSKLLRTERATAEPTVSHILNESKPQPAARSLSSQRHSAQKPSDQDGTSQTPPQPHPRRRLASFGGVSSPGSLSPFTGLSAYNQNNNGNKPAGAGGETQAHLSSSLGTRGSTGCLKLSPESSGRSTPVSGLGPVHLQHVRDQMVVALQKLKEMEEQVKIIPILQVKISVLQEEKRQLISQLKNQRDGEDTSDGIWKRLDNSDRSDTGKKVIGSDGNDVKEFRQLSEEMQALERTVKGGSLPAWHGKGHSHQKESAIKSVTVGSDKDRDRTLSKPLKENKHMCTDRLEMKSIGTEVYEGNLGIYTEREAELDAQKRTIGALKERIRHLEAELKESALQNEMSRLKLELHAAGARNRSDKASSARSSTDGAGIVAKPNTTSQGVGNHTEYRDAGTGETTEVRSIGTCCYKPEFKDVGTEPDVPMSKWVVRERVEVVEKGVGNHVFTNTQGVGMEVKLCDAETNTEVPVENLDPKKGKIKYNSVACGDCSVDVIIYEAKDMVSQGISTSQVRGVNQGVMASPHTASQRTNTVSSSVSRFTSTRHAFNTDSSTNTVLSTKDKHTNTAQAITRTASVGTRLRDMKCTPETCTSLLASASKQTQGTVTKVTKDTGVGFTDINDNFLVGLKTRNMASGPSHLPDPLKTRSIGVGEGRIRDLTSGKPSQKTQQPAPSQWEPELNHYIEKMHRLLTEHGNLLTEDRTHQREGFVSHPSKQESASTRVSSNGKVAAQGGTEIRPLDVQPPVGRKFQSPSQLSVEQSKCDKANPETSREGANDSEVRRMIQMLEQQTSSALQDKSTNMLRSVIRKQNGDQGCSSSRKSLKFLRATTGLEPVSPNKVNAEEGGDKRGRKKVREATQDGVPTKKASKSVSTRGVKGCKLSEKIVSACQALKAHLNDDTALSSKELHDCVQTLQQEWFSVSSQKSADPDTVEDYLSTFRIVSPSVLQHIANMADGNGNTALHYSVSHSNFGIVRKLLDAEVCSVDHQNKAGYTPIMLAALSAVESPEDMRVVEKLFTKGDVNAKASQAGQTALMLAVSHGRMGMVQALLRRGADVNLQDDEGSTALMCASEHGHADIVRLLLAQPDCDTTLTDNEDSTALSIALEAGQNDIAVLLYAHANFSKGQTGMSGSRVSH